MTSLFTWARRRRGVASAVALAVIAGVPLTVALLHRGFPENSVTLNSSDVWVTNGDKLEAGRLNHQINQLDAEADGSSQKIDVLQNGGGYFLSDPEHGSVQRIDQAYVTLNDRITVPQNSAVAYGGNTMAILSPSGSLWVLNAGGHLAFDATKTKTSAKLGAHSAVTVTTTGEVFAASADTHTLVTQVSPEAHATTQPFDVSRGFQLSAVGAKPVVLSADGRSLLQPGAASIRLPQRALQLQQAGPGASDALAASDAGLMSIPLGGGTPQMMNAGSGDAAANTSALTSAPVRLGSCDYAAWAGTGRYLYACDGQPARAMNIGQPVTGDDLVFRVNHGVIALNDLRNGNAWVVSSHMQLVQNWAQLKPSDTEVQGTSGAQKPVLESYQQTLAQRTRNNRPPIAVDDNFGVRPGRTTILPVLDNDTDPDGDVLTITSLPVIPASEGTLQLIEGARALQFTPANGLTGTVSFRYSIDDGRGGTASAQVNVSVHPFSVNAAPHSTRASTAQVEVGQSVSYDVLQDFIDPDGDDIYLSSATPTTDDDVQFTPDGYITFTSKTGQTGSKQVNFTVSDGRLSTSGELLVTVKPDDTLPPVAVPDFSQAPVGQATTITPLANDVSPSGDQLTLVSVSPSDGGNLPFTANTDTGTVTVTPNATGEYYLQYVVAGGSHSATGLIRVNVPAGTDDSAPPVAVKDTAYVRPGESTEVDVLDNDSSPSGRVLAVKSVTAGANASALNIEVLDNTVVKITAPTVLPDQVQLSYTVSDGLHEASAAIAVVPVAPLVNHQPPIALDDTATVRAGDIASVPVLDNDYSPDNEPFTLDPTLVPTANAGPGATAFVSGSDVRYEAPKTPGEYSVVYGVSDQFGQHAQATVSFIVTALDFAKDRAPEPQPLTVRTFAGSTIPVNVPLNGIDPDGDSVTLVGIQTQPSLGRIAATTTTGFTYTAYPSSAGTDQFTYTVEDTYGKKATGTVRVGVIPRPSTVANPIAINDSVQVKPGKTVSVAVLANDSDPNGYPISLDHKLAEVDPGLKASVHGQVVLITAPQQQGGYVLRYSISNGHGGVASAYVQVQVTNLAKPVYPTAIDHAVQPDQVAAKNSVTVDALDGATDPSGLVSDLKVGVTGQNASSATVNSGGTITVTPATSRMIITYTVTDPTTNLSADAFIIVPPKGDATAPPHLKADVGTPIVPMKQSKTWTLSQLLDVPSGRPVKLTGASGVTATSGNGSYLDDQTIKFQAASGYRGPASVTFKVDDGRDPGQTSDRVTSIVLPLTVGDPDQTDVPPTFTPPHVNLQPGEAATTINLRASSYHPNPQMLASLTYSGLDTTNSNGITASLSGSELTLAAPLGVQPGVLGAFHFTISSGTFQIPGSVSVSVVSSTRPIATQIQAQSGEMKRGTSVTLSNATGDSYWSNPFPGQPLTITSATLQSAPSGVSVSHTDTSITVSAASGADIGSVNVLYHVQDATKDPARTAQTSGRYTVTIHDVPSTPDAPTDVRAGNASATMNITAPAANGKTISQYEISYDNGTHSQTQSSPGSVSYSGLTNGTSYSFEVRALNADGWSDWSAASASVTPYGTPKAVSGATLTNTGTYAKTTMQLTWSKLSGPGETGGGSITYEYNFDGGGWKSTTATTVNESGVDAGNHSFQVRAKNSGGNTGPTSTSNTVTVDNPPPPSPTVTLARGNYMTDSNCEHGCYYYRTTLANFSANSSHTIVYYCNGSASGYSDTVTTNGSGGGTFDSENMPSEFRCGYPNTWVTVDGKYSSAHQSFKP